MPLSEFKQRVTIEGLDELDRLKESLEVGHRADHSFRNWEWMMHAANAHGDIPIDPVYKRLRNEGAERFAYGVRSRLAVSRS